MLQLTQLILIHEQYQKDNSAINYEQNLQTWTPDTKLDTVNDQSKEQHKDIT